MLALNSNTVSAIDPKSSRFERLTWSVFRSLGFTGLMAVVPVILPDDVFGGTKSHDESFETPIAYSQEVSTDKDQPILVQIAGTDSSIIVPNYGEDFGCCNYEITSPPVNGTAVIEGGSFADAPTPANVSYAPDPGFVGTDSFKFVVRNPWWTSSEATVSINVGGAALVDTTTPVFGWSYFSQSITESEASGWGVPWEELYEEQRTFYFGDNRGVRTLKYNVRGNTGTNPNDSAEPRSAIDDITLTFGNISTVFTDANTVTSDTIFFEFPSEKIIRDDGSIYSDYTDSTSTDSLSVDLTRTYLLDEAKAQEKEGTYYLLAVSVSDEAGNERYYDAQQVETALAEYGLTPEMVGFTISMDSKPDTEPPTMHWDRFAHIGVDDNVTGGGTTGKAYYLADRNDTTTIGYTVTVTDLDPSVEITLAFTSGDSAGKIWMTGTSAEISETAGPTENTDGPTNLVGGSDYKDDGVNGWNVRKVEAYQGTVALQPTLNNIYQIENDGRELWHFLYGGGTEKHEFTADKTRGPVGRDAWSVYLIDNEGVNELVMNLWTGDITLDGPLLEEFFPGLTSFSWKVYEAFKADGSGTTSGTTIVFSDGNTATSNTATSEATLEFTVDGSTPPGAYYLNRVELTDSTGNRNTWIATRLSSALSDVGKTRDSMGFIISTDITPPAFDWKNLGYSSDGDVSQFDDEESRTFYYGDSAATRTIGYEVRGSTGTNPNDSAEPRWAIDGITLTFGNISTVFTDANTVTSDTIFFEFPHEKIVRDDGSIYSDYLEAENLNVRLKRNYFLDESKASARAGTYVLQGVSISDEGGNRVYYDAEQVEAELAAWGKTPESVGFTISMDPSAPVADVQSVTVSESVHTLNTPHDITLAGSDRMDRTLVFSIITEPENGTLRYDDDNDRLAGYLPNPGYLGLDSFEFTVTNEDGVTSDRALVNITVQETSDRRELWADAAFNRGDRADDLRQEDYDRVMASDDPATEFETLVRIATVKSFGSPNDKLLSIAGDGADIWVEVPSLDLAAQPLSDYDVARVEGHFIHPNGGVLFVPGYDDNDFMTVYQIDLSTLQASVAFDQNAVNSALNDSASYFEVESLSFNVVANAVRLRAFYPSDGSSRLVEIPVDGREARLLWSGDGQIMMADDLAGRDRFIFQTEYDDQYGQGRTPWLFDLKTSTTTQLPDNLFLCCGNPSNLSWIAADGTRSLAIDFATEGSPHYLLDLKTGATEEIAIPSASSWVGADNERDDFPVEFENVDNISFEFIREWDWVMSWTADGQKILVGTQVEHEIEISVGDSVHTGSAAYNSLALYDPRKPSDPLVKLGSYWGENDWAAVGLSSDGRYLLVPTKIQDPRNEGRPYGMTTKVDLTGVEDPVSIPYRTMSLAGRIRDRGRLPSGWQLPMTVAFDVGSARQIVYGVADWADDGRDMDNLPFDLLSYSENEPPPLPPLGANDARFLYDESEYNGTYVDVRSSEIGLSDTLAWKLQIFSTSNVVLRWDPRRLNDLNGTFLIREIDDNGEILRNIDMRTADSIVSEYFENYPKRSLLLYFTRTSLNISYQLDGGWNMVSAPGNTPFNDFKTMFPGAISLWQWQNEGNDGQYLQAETVGPGIGYWINLQADLSTMMPAERASNRRVSMSQGWNIIGGFENRVSVADLRRAVPQVRNVYGFDGMYLLANELEPGKGYWVQVKDKAIVLDFEEFEEGDAFGGAARPSVVTSSNLPTLDAVADAGTISLQLGATDAEVGALPPVPPPGIMDARIILDGYDSRMSPAETDIYPVRFQEVRELAWNIDSLLDGLWSLELADGRVIALRGAGSVSIGSGVVHGLLHQQKRSQPVEFKLTGNFPNPFNPTTNVGYQVGAAGNVHLEIFNVLGQRVRLLVDAEQSAGAYRVVWDGRDDNGHVLAAGTYLLRMRSGAFIQTKKMVLAP